MENQHHKNRTAVDMIGNKYDVIFIAAKRAKDLSKGLPPLIDSKNGPCVTALREIELGLINRDYLNND